MLSPIFTFDGAVRGGMPRRKPVTFPRVGAWGKYLGLRGILALNQGAQEFHVVDDNGQTTVVLPVPFWKGIEQLDLSSIPKDRISISRTELKSLGY